jgi:hypothetical protein
MAKIKMTKELILNSFMSTSTETFGGGIGFGGSTKDGGIQYDSISRFNRLILCGGVPPTPAEHRAATPPIQGSSNQFRRSDQLVWIDYSSLYSGYADGAFTFKESPYGTAHRGGIATWFQLLAFQGSENYCYAIGDVSDLAGSGVIKLPNTNIALNDRVSIKPLRLVMPFEYDY